MGGEAYLGLWCCLVPFEVGTPRTVRPSPNLLSLLAESLRPHLEWNQGPWVTCQAGIPGAQRPAWQVARGCGDREELLEAIAEMGRQSRASWGHLWATGGGQGHQDLGSDVGSAGGISCSLWQSM